MGQQQLLLVILVTILVGIATVVALNVFGSAAEEANRDAVRQDLLNAAAQGQAIFARPALLDGAGRNFDTGLDSNQDLLERLGMPATSGFGDCADTELGNDNGCYEVTARTERDFTIVGKPSSDPANTITARVEFRTTVPDGEQPWTIHWNE